MRERTKLSIVLDPLHVRTFSSSFPTFSVSFIVITGGTRIWGSTRFEIPDLQSIYFLEILTKIGPIFGKRSIRVKFSQKSTERSWQIIIEEQIYLYKRSPERQTNWEIGPTREGLLLSEEQACLYLMFKLPTALLISPLSAKKAVWHLGSQEFISRRRKERRTFDVFAYGTSSSLYLMF